MAKIVIHEIKKPSTWDVKVTFVFTVYNDGTIKNLMSLTGTIPVLFQGDFALMDPFFICFLKCIASIFFLQEFMDTLRKS